MVAAARVACRCASSKYAGTVMTAFLTVHRVLLQHAVLLFLIFPQIIPVA